MNPDEMIALLRQRSPEEVAARRAARAHAGPLDRVEGIQRELDIHPTWCPGDHA